MSAKTLGDRGEARAESYLTKSGCKIISRNYRRRYGEIDLIYFDAETLAFGEVKYRLTNRYGTPSEAVTPYKTRKILLTATQFLQEHPCYQDAPVRFDIICVSKQVRWMKDSFNNESLILD
ncbi:MAG: YraN family protein [Gammaproteobacteria bacterium]|nr:YraN family protein [Gammaproteobacteria bacterium]MBT5203308.1 YraN family protein [Gammaproteobacteria bacterium]MBT5600647.1 YraN family protein [Gammaproteobacteria bacterium]MBT6244560.1 YraN family protein [Gammaproteobacteria bacterium]